MSINSAKLQELKDKYSISDDDMAGLGRIEEEEEGPDYLPKERLPMGTTLQRAMSGDVSIAEAIILLDYMDRAERRREERSMPNRYQPTDQLTQLIDRMDKRIEDVEQARKEDFAKFTELLLGKRIDEAESRAKIAEGELQRQQEQAERRQSIEDAIRSATAQYGPELKELREKVSSFPAERQRTFWDEVLGGYEDELKQDIISSVRKKLTGEADTVTTTTEGKPVVDWGKIMERGFRLADKYIETMKTAPPRLGVRTIPQQIPQQGKGSEVSTEPTEAAPQEEKIPPMLRVEPKIKASEEVPRPPVEAPPLPLSTMVDPSPPTTDVTGIGPKTAEKLAELGITNAFQLAQANPEELAQRIGVPVPRATDWIKSAKDIVE